MKEAWVNIKEALNKLRQNKDKLSEQILDDIATKSTIIRTGIDGEFWRILSEALVAEIEAGRDALESSTVLTPKTKQEVMNNDYWRQYQRGCINALRILLGTPEAILDKGEYAKELLNRYKEE